MVLVTDLLPNWSLGGDPSKTPGRVVGAPDVIAICDIKKLRIGPIDKAKQKITHHHLMKGPERTESSGKSTDELNGLIK